MKKGKTAYTLKEQRERERKGERGEREREREGGERGRERGEREGQTYVFRNQEKEILHEWSTNDKDG